MKKILILVVGILIGTAAFAQENNNQNKTYKVYCEIVAQTRLLSDKVDIEFDFGQASDFWTGDRRLYNEKGEPIVFNSMLDAANYMARRGWQLEQAFQVLNISGGYSDNPVYHWIMSKQVTDDSQITEGLTTGDMLKK